jgi:hypothetical protein
MPALGRHGHRLRRVLPLAVGVLVALFCGVALTVTHHKTPMAVAPRVAIRAVLRNPGAVQARAGSHWNRITVTAIDNTLVHVSFLTHGQLVADAAVNRAGKVLSPTNDRLIRVPYGNWIAYEPALLVALSALFVLMTAVAPWRRLRNLDVVAALSLVTAVVLFEYRYLTASVLAAAPGLRVHRARPDGPSHVVHAVAGGADSGGRHRAPRAMAPRVAGPADDRVRDGRRRLD